MKMPSKHPYVFLLSAVNQSNLITRAGLILDMIIDGPIRSTRQAAKVPAFSSKRFISEKSIGTFET
jgi:hypothetical protein